MQKFVLLGMVTMVLGSVILVHQAMNIVKEGDVIDFGPVEGSVDQQRWIPFPPLAGIGLVVGGLLLLRGQTPSRF